MNNPTGAGQLHNKTAVVTGGSRGIGRAIIEAFISEGARVVTSSRNAPDSDLPEAVHWLQADVSSPTQVDALAEFAVGQLGNIDILVNNAGVQLEKTVVNSSDADWDQLMGTNARGVFLVCRRFIPIMAASSGGSIINIGSISGEHADPTMALYNASKAFVAGLTRSIAVDHGAEGIRCNTICPGWIMTGMVDAAFSLASDPAASKADGLARHPVGRWGQPEDIAAAAVWLASDQSAFTTGQSITVDGGLVAASPLQPGLF